MGNTYYNNFIGNATSDADPDIGPSSTFTRNSKRYNYNDYTLRFGECPEDVPGHMRTQLLKYYPIPSNDFSDSSWVKNNCTVAKDTTDSQGVPNNAWTLTDDTATGSHVISLPDRELGWYSRRTFEVKKGTARYILFSVAEATTVAFNIRRYTSIFDLDTGEIVFNSYRYAEADLSLSEGGTYDVEIDPLNDGWWKVSWRTYGDTGNPQLGPFLTLGIANGPNEADMEYTGTGNGTAHFARVSHSDDPRDARPITPHLDYLETTGAESEEIYAINYDYKYGNLIPNSVWRGASDGVPPEGRFYTGLPDYWTYRIEHSTGQGISVTSPNDSKFPREGPRYGYPNTPALGIKFLCDNERYVMAHNLYYGAGGWAHNEPNYLFSIWVTDIVTPTDDYIIQFSDHPNVVSAPPAKLSDADENGRIDIPIVFTGLGPNTGEPWPFTGPDDDPLIMYVGAGINGDTTAEFTLHSPLLFPGHEQQDYEPAYRPNSGGTRPIEISNRGDGILITEERTNLIAQSRNIDDSVWQKNANTQMTAINGYYGWNGNLSDEFGGLNLGGTGPVNVSQSISNLKTSTRYTLNLYLAWGRSRDSWGRIDINHAGQDLTVWVDLDQDGEYPADPTLGTVGADVVEAKVYGQVLSDSVGVLITFITDSADTNATLVVSAADAQDDDQVVLDGNGHIYLTEVMLYEGDDLSIDSYVPNETMNPVTYGADILKTADMSWYNSKSGTIFTDFGSPFFGTISPKTVLSIDDGTANNRNVIEAGNGSDAKIRFTSYENGTQKYLLEGPEITSYTDPLFPTYPINRVAIAYDENKATMYYNNKKEFSDDFDRSDQPLNNSEDWLQAKSFPSLELIDGKVTSSLEYGSSSAYANIVNADCFVEVEIYGWDSLAGTYGTVGLHLRMVNDQQWGERNQFWLESIDGVARLLCSHKKEISPGNNQYRFDYYPLENLTFVEGAVFRVEAVNDTYNIYYNGELIFEWIDGAVTGLGRENSLGLSVTNYETPAIGVLRVDNFRTGDLGHTEQLLTRTDDFDRTELGPAWVTGHQVGYRDSEKGLGTAVIENGRVISSRTDGYDRYSPIEWKGQDFGSDHFVEFQIRYDDIEGIKEHYDFWTASLRADSGDETEWIAYIDWGGGSDFDYDWGVGFARRDGPGVDYVYYASDYTGDETKFPDGTLFRFEMEGTTMRLYANEELILSDTATSQYSGQTGILLSAWHYNSKEDKADNFVPGIDNVKVGKVDRALPVPTKMNMGSDYNDSNQVNSVIRQVWYDTSVKPDWQLEDLVNNNLPTFTKHNTRIREVDSDKRIRVIKKEEV